MGLRGKTIVGRADLGLLLKRKDYFQLFTAGNEAYDCMEFYRRLGLGQY